MVWDWGPRRQALKAPEASPLYSRYPPPATARAVTAAWCAPASTLRSCPLCGPYSLIAPSEQPASRLLPSCNG